MFLTIAVTEQMKHLALSLDFLGSKSTLGNKFWV